MAKKIGLTQDVLGEKLSDKGLEFEILESASDQQMAEHASRASGRVIVVGGDGTIHSLLQAVNKCGAMRLGIIPIGLANYLAKALGIPTGLEAAIDVIVAGHTRRIDLGKANSTIFCQAAGVGFHAAVFKAYGEHKEKSTLDAMNAALSTLVDWTPQLVRVIIDGEPYLEEVTQVTASNTPTYGGQFTIAPEAVIDDGLLDIIVVGKLNKVEVLEYAAAALRGGIRSLSKTHATRARTIEVAAVASEEIPLHADAVAVGYTPAAIEVLPGCLEVMVPRGDAR